MRALCGAIITAGAFIGLGLTALAFGVRYSHIPTEVLDPEGKPVPNTAAVRWADTDHPLVYCLVILTIVGFIGLGIAFLGLMYHHYRRHHEFLKEHGRAPHGEPFGMGTSNRGPLSSTP